MSCPFLLILYFKLFETDVGTGGIWARVNKTSGLQLNSLLYRFHPAVLWSKSFPQRDEILKGPCAHTDTPNYAI